MNNILLKVQQYLDNVSKNPVKLDKQLVQEFGEACNCLLYTSPSPRDVEESRMPSSA